MAQPVWTLSVDLQTKTATFQSGMSDAAKAARGSFNDIKEGAREMGAETGFSMTEARHSVMLLGEEFGIHLPRALTSFIASLGPIGAAMQAAFPFLAIIVGATLLLEHLSKLKEQGEKLTESQINFGTATANVLNGLNDKLLQAGMRADELRGDHLGALHRQLELIDHQSMNELVQSFNALAKESDMVLGQLKTSWYSLDAGSAKAKQSLDEFRAKYEALLAAHKDTEAGDFLAGTLKSQQRILELQKQAKDNQTVTGTHENHNGDYLKFEEAKNALKQLGYTFDEKEVASQESVVRTLQDQVAAAQTLKSIQAQDKKNATTEEANKEAAEQEKITEIQQRGLERYKRIREEEERKARETRAKAVKEEEELAESKIRADDAFYSYLKKQEEERAKLGQEAGKISAEHETKMGELQLAADKEAGQMRMMQGRMTEAEIADMEMSFAAREYATKQAALNAELAALDTHDKEYINRKQQLNNKLLELDKQYQNQAQQLENQAAKKQQATIQDAEQRLKGMYAEGFASVLTGKQSFARMMSQIDMQIISSALKNEIQGLMSHNAIQDRKRFGDARTAAADAFASAGNPILGAVAAAGAFASVMAFEQGGIVPGVGRGDSVPAMLEPGEGVITKKIMDGLTNRAKFGGSDGGGDVHVHHHATYNVHAIDADGVHQMLREHGDKFTNHAVNTLRKMNR